MKFRILEQRGKFRIEAYVKTGSHTPAQFETMERKKSWLHTHTIETRRFFENYEWRRMYLTDSRPRMVAGGSGGYRTHGLGAIIGGYTPPSDNHEVIFDSYEEAEDFIFQQYGWEGWRSIEKPEWKTV